MIERKNEFRVRLSRDERIMLEQIADTQGETGATVLRRCIRELWQMLPDEAKNKPTKRAFK